MFTYCSRYVIIRPNNQLPGGESYMKRVELVMAVIDDNIIKFVVRSTDKDLSQKAIESIVFNQLRRDNRRSVIDDISYIGTHIVSEVEYSKLNIIEV